MARRPFRSRVNDPRLFNLDDDLPTLLDKTEAVFKQKKAFETKPNMSPAQRAIALDANRQQVMTKAPAKRGLMRRDSE